MTDTIQHEDGRVELTSEAHDEITRSPLFNEDLAPVPIAKRNWTTYNYAALWIAMAHCIPTYMMASGLIATNFGSSSNTSEAAASSAHAKPIRKSSPSKCGSWRCAAATVRQVRSWATATMGMCSRRWAWRRDPFGVGGK